MKVYIVGKISGLEYQLVCKKFAKAEREIEKKGWVPINPTKFIPEKTPWNKAMKIAILLLLQADAIYLLPDWMDSKGGFLEFEIAYNLGLKIFESNAVDTSNTIG